MTPIDLAVLRPFESDMVIVENLTNLDRLPEGAVEFSCFPLHFQQADGSPVRAVAFTD